MNNRTTRIELEDPVDDITLEELLEKVLLTLKTQTNIEQSS